MELFTKRVIDIIRAIPVGKVMTYGQIARCAGNPGGARQVARILHSMSKKYKLPWHRVINAKGKISDHRGSIIQKIYLQDEGIVIIGQQIKVKEYLHEPNDQDIEWQKC